MIVLGIESSCDETSVAILSGDKLKSNLISSQHFHTNFGGVVPELSSREHIKIIKPLVDKALVESGISLEEINLVAATAGPGLIGALLVGLTFAKGLSFSLGKPFIGVNHIEGHIFSGFLADDKPEFPMLVLVVSGGHTLLLKVDSYKQIFQLGSTVDDAAGEAFDKVSKMLGFGYPGGPEIEAASRKGDETKINFPIAELKDPYNFSFSGLKTAVLRYLQSNFEGMNNIPDSRKNDIAASFQRAAVEALTQKVEKALEQFEFNTISLVGGVAANENLRTKIIGLAIKYDKKVVIPGMEFCGDNAAMIGMRGKFLYDSGERHSLNLKPYATLRPNYFDTL